MSKPDQPGFWKSDVGESLKHGLLIGLVLLTVAIPAVRWMQSHRQVPVAAPVAAVATPRSAAPAVPAAPRFADFGGEEASDDVRHIANWVVDSGDNQRMNFVILDKLNTKVFVFDAKGKLNGASPVLLGATPGDDAVAGIGQRPMNQVRQDEKTTAAGRFVAQAGHNTSGEDVIWVDYDAAVSMHRVRIVDPKERRLERLATPTSADNRISYGCINVPVAFFEGKVQPAFLNRRGIVYVMPEIKTVQQVFPASYDVAQKHGMPAG